MQFTNETRSFKLDITHSTPKAFLFSFGSVLPDIGDVTLSFWVPNFVVSKIGKHSSDYLSKGIQDVDLKVINDFEFRLFNKELNVEIKGDINDLLHAYNLGVNN